LDIVCDLCEQRQSVSDGNDDAHTLRKVSALLSRLIVVAAFMAHTV
jgi:hypothetical protein